MKAHFVFFPIESWTTRFTSKGASHIRRDISFGFNFRHALGQVKKVLFSTWFLCELAFNFLLNKISTNFSYLYFRKVKLEQTTSEDVKINLLEAGKGERLMIQQFNKKKVTHQVHAIPLYDASGVILGPNKNNNNNVVVQKSHSSALLLIKIVFIEWRRINWWWNVGRIK